MDIAQDIRNTIPAWFQKREVGVLSSTWKAFKVSP